MAVDNAKIAAAKERLKDHPGGQNLKMILIVKKLKSIRSVL